MAVFNDSRLQRRFLTHHLPFLLISLALFLPLYFTRPYKDVIARASFATAYPALGFLVASLMLGPWNVLRRKRNPVSNDLRRDTGIWAGALSLLHSVIGQCVHLRGRPWLYYVYPQDRHHPGWFRLRHDLWGFSNETGLLAALVVIALLVTSNDLALRKLGAGRWKSLQRWSYAAFALAAAHTIGYQIPQNPTVSSFHVVAWVCIGLTVVVQVAGFISRRRTRA